MKKIIAIQSRADKINRAVIKQTWDWLKRNPFCMEVIPAKRSAFNIITVLNIDGVRIGITTKGGNAESLRSQLDLFEQKNCDILICPCRTRGKTYETVKSFERKGYDMDFIESLEFSESTDHLIKEILKSQVLRVKERSLPEAPIF